MPTLEKSIEDYVHDFKEKVSEESFNKINDVIQGLKSSNLKDRSLKVGNKISEFTLSNQDSKIINIKDIIEKNNYTVISFFRGSWSPYCIMQLNALQKIVSQLKILHPTLITASPQTPDKSKYTKDKYSFNF